MEPSAPTPGPRPARSRLVCGRSGFLDCLRLRSGFLLPACPAEVASQVYGMRSRQRSAGVSRQTLDDGIGLQCRADDVRAPPVDAELEIPRRRKELVPNRMEGLAVLKGV